jgi:hypothetical protein
MGSFQLQSSAWPFHQLDGTVHMEAISAWAMRFQAGRCDFSMGDAISRRAMRFQAGQCDFSMGDVISGWTM